MQQTKIPPKHTIEPVISTSEPESTEQQVAISFVVPVMNEEQSIAILFEKLSTQLDSLGQSYEVIFVDDGSTDNTFAELKKLHNEYPAVVRVIRFRRNFGKTPALVAGFERCRGEIIFTMDGDLQDDPEEIPNFLAKLDEGYDLVSGWKFPRLEHTSNSTAISIASCRLWPIGAASASPKSRYATTRANTASPNLAPGVSLAASSIYSTSSSSPLSCVLH